MQSLPNYPSQWQCLMNHLGQWQGTFTEVSPLGTVGQSRPSVVTLAGCDENRRIRQTIVVAGNRQVLEYGGLGRGILLCADGAFSQGSLQWGPLGEFGAELGLIDGDQRVRCALVYENSQCRHLTLIREQRGAGRLGQGERHLITQLYPDWRTPAALSGGLTRQRSAAQVTLRWQLETETGVWCGVHQADHRYEQGHYRLLVLEPEIWVWFPPRVPQGVAFHLGLLWRGQALLRRYDRTGAWVDLTQVQGVVVADGY
ncbi:MAG: DUF3598 family protein [Gloeomargarita sp. DG02_4_bins_56]